MYNKKLDLHNIRPGAVVTSEPKVILIKMVARPAPSRILALRKKFNAILEETLYKTSGMYIMDAGIHLNAAHFNRSNYLVSNGKITYWQTVDDIISEFDIHKGPKLKPEPVISSAPTKKEPRFALAKPPSR